jgi:hypothetical protein
MDNSGNLNVIYTRTTGYEKQLGLIDDIKDKITDNQYLELMNNLKAIKENENRMLDRIYRLKICQVELISPPNTGILIPNIVPNEIIGLNISSGAVAHIRSSYGETVSARMLREMGFNIPTYCGYTFDGRFEGRMKIKNDLIYIQSIQEPCIGVNSILYSDMEEEEGDNAPSEVIDIRVFGGNA